MHYRFYHRRDNSHFVLNVKVCEFDCVNLFMRSRYHNSRFMQWTITLQPTGYCHNGNIKSIRPTVVLFSLYSEVHSVIERFITGRWSVNVLAARRNVWLVHRTYGWPISFWDGDGPARALETYFEPNIKFAWNKKK